jgi:hypothetical protein
VKQALTGANPANQNAFRVLREYLATQGGNPQLQFIPYTSAQSMVNLGTSLVGGACTLYGWYATTKRAAAGVAAFTALHDAADNSATTTTIDTAKVDAVTTSQAFAIIHPLGRAIATDVVISSATAVGGATESAAADGNQGFIIVGA